MWQGSYEFVVNQWGVGHGGFHSQSLHFQAHDRNPTAPIGIGSGVRVIYDCGSGRTNNPRRALTDAIGRMLHQVPNGSIIDLLVISHFDRDHVNGLEGLAIELVKKHVKVIRVWAPVLTKVEALFAITTSDLTGAARQSYAALLGDPGSQLAAMFDGADVTFIGPNDEPIPLPPSGMGTDYTDADGGGDIVLMPTPDGRGLIASPGAFPAGEALWEFQPYVTTPTLVGADAVSALVRRLLGKPVEQCSVADLIALADDKTILKAFHDAIKQQQRLTVSGLRESSARTGANLSSLCVYSGPVSPYDWCHFRRGWGPVDEMRRAIPIAPAWLGTGDAGLLRNQHVDALRSALTHNRLDRVGIVSAPHHGSRLDSGPPLWDALPNARWVTVEAGNLTGGTGNSHPHTQVLTELANRELVVHPSIDEMDFYWSDKRIR